MLKGIPRTISPELLKVLSEMGHGDELVIGDGNFQGASLTKNILIRYDASNIPDILDSILQIFPLDTDSNTPVAVMQPDKAIEAPKVWAKYKEIVTLRCENESIKFEKMERYAFYERARKAYAIVTTSEEELYANVILKKGVI